MTKRTSTAVPYCDPVPWTRQERYWIGKIVSETGEFGQAAGNAMCFGIDTPDHNTMGRAAMQDEIGDIIAAVRIAIRAGIFSLDAILARAGAKEAKLLDGSQRDNLGRRLAPPVPAAADWHDLLASEATAPTDVTTVPSSAPAPDDEPAPLTLTTPWELSSDVLAHLEKLTRSGATTPDAILRRILKIDETVAIPQDGTVGYRDPASGLILPEGFAIERTFRGLTYRATATNGGFLAQTGTWHKNLNRLNVSLPLTRPENAWNEWCFVDAQSIRRRLSTARPITALRQRKLGRRVSARAADGSTPAETAFPRDTTTPRTR